MEELRKNEMYRPFHAPARPRHVDSYGAKKRLYLLVLLLGLVAAIALIAKGLHGGISGLSGKRIVKARRDMGKCIQYFGKVAIFVADSKYFKKFELARRSLKCYVKGTDYKLVTIDMDTDARVKSSCGNHKIVWFKRHCAASVYLQDAEWMLVLNTETGVVNPEHCIEEWIDDRVDMIFYERFFNWEITSGSYLVRNTEFSRMFLRKLADWEFKMHPPWNSNDQGAFMLLLQATLIPYASWEFDTCYDYWKKATSYQMYSAMVTCVRLALGAQKLWLGKVRILRKAHAWSRDAQITNYKWAEKDFMLHIWKDSLLDKNCPFTRAMDPGQCGGNLREWHWKKESKLDTSSIKQLFEKAEEHYRTEFPNKGRVIPYLEYPEIGRCYPLCEKRRKLKV